VLTQRYLERWPITAEDALRGVSPVPDVVPCSLVVHGDLAAPTRYEFVENVPGGGECIVYRVMGAGMAGAMARTEAPTLGIFSGGNLWDFQRFAPSILNQWTYANHWGYAYYFTKVDSRILDERSVYFIKVSALRPALRLHEQIIWIDRDAYFNIPAAFAEPVEAYMEGETDGTSLVITGHEMSLLSGLLLMRSNEFTERFVERWWESGGGGYFRNFPGDQLALQHVFLTEFSRNGTLEYDGECYCTGRLNASDTKTLEICNGKRYGYGCFNDVMQGRNLINGTMHSYLLANDTYNRMRMSIGCWGTDYILRSGCSSPNRMVSWAHPNNTNRCLHDGYSPAYVIHPGSINYEDYDIPYPGNPTWKHGRQEAQEEFEAIQARPAPSCSIKIQLGVNVLYFDYDCDAAIKWLAERDPYKVDEALLTILVNDTKLVETADFEGRHTQSLDSHPTLFDGRLVECVTRLHTTTTMEPWAPDTKFLFNVPR